jgi:hypothetical protein
LPGTVVSPGVERPLGRVNATVPGNPDPRRTDQRWLGGGAGGQPSQVTSSVISPTPARALETGQPALAAVAAALNAASSTPEA